MKKSVLQSDIKKIDQQLENQQLPASVRKALETAKEKAQKILQAGIFDAEKPGSAKAPAKKTASEKGNPSLDEDCEEILARYRKKNEKDASRAKKREKQGKPKELTIPETVGKAAKAVQKKVSALKEKDKKLSGSQSEAAITNIVASVRPIIKIMDYLVARKFIDELTAQLDALIGEHFPHGSEAKNARGAGKAEKGMHLKGAQMHIFHYKTENFDISPQCTEFFKHIMSEPEVIENRKSAVIAMAKDCDKFLGYVKRTELSEDFSKGDFIAAIGGAMRAMHWNYAVTEMLPPNNGWYPLFLLHDMYIVAVHTRKEDSKIMEKGGSTGRHPGLQYEEGDEIVATLTDDQVAQINSSLSNDDDSSDTEIVNMWAGMGIPKSKGKHVIKKYRATFRINPLFELAKRTYEEGGKTGPDTGKKDRIVQELSDYDLDMVNSTLANDEESSDEEIVQYLVDNDMNKIAAQHIVTKYRPIFFRIPLFQLEKVYEKGGKVKFKDKVKAIEKNLEGKPVPKKYRKTEGKKFTKKTATAAARRIAGSLETKRTKKFLLGGVAIHTPNNISSLGDQNNLDIH